MDNKKKLLIGGGIAAAVIIIFSVLILVFGGEETQKEKNTTGLKSTSNTTEEHTTLKEVADNDTTRKEEPSDEETTSLTEDDSSEGEETTNTVANADKETTTKKPTATTKRETTTQEQTTTKKPETTTAKQTTTKQETTTQEQTTATPKPQSGRIKECELELINKCFEFRPDGVNVGNVYTDLGNELNPFIYQRNVFGWDNIVFYFDVEERPPYTYYEGDDFTVKYSDDKNKQIIIRDMHFKRKYNQAIINDFYEWVENPSKYGGSEGFGQYLQKRYASQEDGSIFSSDKIYNPNGSSDDMYDGYKKEWCEEWCYFDTQLQKYRTRFRPHYVIKSLIIEKEGYYKNVEEVYKQIKEEHEFFIGSGSFLCRWVYDAKTDKTRIFVVCSI